MMKTWELWTGVSTFQGAWEDFESILEREAPFRRLAVLLSGLLLGWWVYVPLHELLHAAGCLLGGGEVSRLEIRALYGGKVLAQLFSFVTVGGDYAGRLSGFDTGGSDWTYAVTIVAPFGLCLAGLILARFALARRKPFLLGVSLPMAVSPLLSLTGDFLELGSLVLYQLWPGPENSNRSLISDDLFRLVGEWSDQAWTWEAVSFVAASQAVAVVSGWLLLVVLARAAGFGRTLQEGAKG